MLTKAITQSDEHTVKLKVKLVNPYLVLNTINGVCFLGSFIIHTFK